MSTDREEKIRRQFDIDYDEEAKKDTRKFYDKGDFVAGVIVVGVLGTAVFLVILGKIFGAM
jgi:hypothetical protein